MRRTLKGHSTWVNSVAFSRDGKLLASGSYDGSTKLWDVATGREVATLYTLDRSEWAVVTPDGRFDASPGGAKLMRYVSQTQLLDVDLKTDRNYRPGLLRKLLR
jgi:WD40 repeat protein